MAITSLGYDGQITELDVPVWARALGGLDYAVRDAASWKVTTVPASARTVQVAPGGGYGRGIADESDTAVSVPLPNPSAGTRWYVICARRATAGAGGATTLTYVGASTPASAGAVDPWAAIAQRAAFETTAGATDEQPLALVRITRDIPAVQQVIDIRCWQANGGVVAADDYARGYLDRPGTQVMIGTDLWVRAVTGTGDTEWRRSALLRPVNLLGAGPAAAGGTVPAGASIYMQAGNHATRSDSNGRVALVFPVAFPNGLLSIVITSGDAIATGGTTFPVDHSPQGGNNLTAHRSRVYYSVIGPNNTRRVNAQHRINWIAIGW